MAGFKPRVQVRNVLNICSGGNAVKNCIIGAKVKTIEERIESLEKSNRRYRLIIAALGLFTVAAVLMGADEPGKVYNDIHTRTLTIVNENGKALIRLTSDKTGAGYFALLNKDEAEMVRIGASSWGDGYLITYDKNGNRLVNLASSLNHTGGVSLLNSSGKEVAVIGTNHVGDGSISLCDSSGNQQTYLASTDNNEGKLTLFNSRGQKLVELAANTFGDGSITTIDQNGKILSSVGSTEKHNAVSALFNRNNMTSLKLQSMDSGDGVFVIYRGSGDVSSIIPEQSTQLNGSAPVKKK